MTNFYKHSIRVLAYFTLAIFTMAITPWSALHHHEEVKVELEKHCSHQYHLKAQGDVCLLCKAHFEKSFIQQAKTFQVYLSFKKVFRKDLILSNTYTRLIATSLRGPPAFS